jgi:Leucine-rich repeat (LRR) protein
MLEFIIHKSQSTNMVILIREKDVLRNTKGGRIRRLSVQSSTKDKVDEVARNNMLSDTVRSLTIIPSSKRDDLFGMKDCKFLRLLDLEGCQGLDKLLDGIYALHYLKYLILRNTDVKKISPSIKNVQCLQTLDIRGTMEIELPVEVILLPKLSILVWPVFAAWDVQGHQGILVNAK